MSKKVKIYSTPTCPWCARAKQFLKENNIEFQDYDVSSDNNAAEVKNSYNSLRKTFKRT